MQYIYNLILEDKKLRGAFVKDPDFGFYFVSEKTQDEYLSITGCPFVITDSDITPIVSSQPKNSDYIGYKITRANGFVYVYALKSNRTIPNVSSLTLDNLGFNDEFELFTGGDFLEFLANICKLPNGNYVCGTVQDYISTIEQITAKSANKEHFFRGHYYYKYSLVPSLYRKKEYFNNESYMYMDFKTHFYNELSHKKYIEILTTMQHYRMPTRLLDTTSNPLVALYMACDVPTNYRNKNYGIGEVIVMSEDIKNVKYSDSNAVTLLSCLAVLETNYKQELYEKIIESQEKNDLTILRNSISYRRFVAEVLNELPSFDESFFTPEVLLKPRHVKVGMINERIIAQSGSFILFGLCNYLTGEHVKLDTVSKERVFIVHRKYITKQLEMLNINSGTMYPDKDHMSVAITKKYD